MSSKNRRKHYFVNKPLQIRYLLYFVFTLLIVTGAAAVGSYYGIWASVLSAFSQTAVRDKLVTAAQIHEYEQARRAARPSFTPSFLRSFPEVDLLSARDREIIREIMDETQKRMAVLGLLLLAFIGWGSIYLTHKVAGPIHKAKLMFREVKKGNLTVRIQFRKYDELKDFAPEFNQTVASLNESIAGMKRSLRNNPPEKAAHEIEKALEHFKTTAD